MFSIRHPVRTWFGTGTIEKVRDEAKFADAKNTLLITDKGVRGAGIADKATKALETAGIRVTIFDECAPEPEIGDLESAYGLFKDGDFDMVVGIGGGSSMDLAKSISILLTNEGSPRDYLGIELVPKPGLPCVLIPTTSGTGAEATPNAIFSVPEKGVKLAIVSTRIIPRAAIVDPELTLSAPPHVTAAAGVDAFTHCLETYVARNATPLSELYSLRGMELIAGSLREVCQNGSDIRARTDMALGSYYGGVALAGAGAGAIHALAYPLGFRFHIPHGVSNSLMFSHVVKENYPASSRKFARIAQILGEDIGGLSEKVGAERSVEAVERLCKDCGVPTHLSEVDVPSHVIPELAEAAFTTQQRLLGFNPKELTQEDIERIYRAAA